MENLSVQLSASESIFAGAVDSVLLFREHAAKAGIEIVPNRVPNDGYWSDIWMKEPWCAAYWSGRPTEDWMFSAGYAADASWNDTFWKHDRFNELLLAARAELDTNKRARHVLGNAADCQ
jgi:peptide/nickel transport system substrate-binding protein